MTGTLTSWSTWTASMSTKKRLNTRIYNFEGKISVTGEAIKRRGRDTERVRRALLQIDAQGTRWIGVGGLGCVFMCVGVGAETSII